MQKLTSIANKPDKNTYFVGHSLGCYIILKYLDNLEEDISVGGVICVGGRLWTEGRETINIDNVKKRAGIIKAFFSDNDYYIPISEADIFREKLGAEVRILHNMGHFSRKENLVELEEALIAVEEISSSNN